MGADVCFLEPDWFQLARRQQDLLNGQEVIFAVGVLNTICRIRIGVTEDMWHAVGVTQNLDVVVFGEKVELGKVFGRYRIGTRRQEPGE